MTKEEILTYFKDINYAYNNCWRYDTLSRMLDELEQEPKTDYKTFAEWVANEIFTEDWDLNKDAFAEIACRKLNKLGIVASEGNVWKLKESEVQE